MATRKEITFKNMEALIQFINHGGRYSVMLNQIEGNTPGSLVWLATIFTNDSSCVLMGHSKGHHKNPYHALISALKNWNERDLAVFGGEEFL